MSINRTPFIAFVSYLGQSVAMAAANWSMGVVISYHFLCLWLSLLPPQRNRPQQAGPHITKDKPVTQEEFGALLYDRLQAVQKDREAMEKKARDRARKQGKSYNEIMVSGIL